MSDGFPVSREKKFGWFLELMTDRDCFMTLKFDSKEISYWCMCCWDKTVFSTTPFSPIYTHKTLENFQTLREWVACGKVNRHSFKPGRFQTSPAYGFVKKCSRWCVIESIIPAGFSPGHLLWLNKWDNDAIGVTCVDSPSSACTTEPTPKLSPKGVFLLVEACGLQGPKTIRTW